VLSYRQVPAGLFPPRKAERPCTRTYRDRFTQSDKDALRINKLTSLVEEQRRMIASQAKRLQELEDHLDCDVRALIDEVVRLRRDREIYARLIECEHEVESG
jgi:hypothetical protein